MDEEKKEVTVDIFPGSLKEYEKLKKSRYEIVDTGKQRKYIGFECDDSSRQMNPSDDKIILNNNIIGIIRSFFVNDCHGGKFYGIPVRKKVKLPKK